MANVRIKDLSTTASTTASDDFFGVDGATNGTRKLSAYSPTFGGNVVATGTLTVNSTTDSSSKDTGAIVTEGGLGVEKSATIGGNLTVSGTGNNVFNASGGNFLIGTTTDVTAYKLQVYGATSANVIAANGVTPDGTKTGGIFGTALGGTGSATGSYASAGDIAGRFVMSAYGNNFIYEAASMQAEITTGGNADRNLHVAALDFYTKGTGSNIVTRNMRLTGSGNLLLGTVIDGGQKLQVSGTAAISGALSIGNTVQTAAAVASTHKVTISIGGSTYYLLATNV